MVVISNIIDPNHQVQHSRNLYYHLLDSLGNVNHAISVVVSWIFSSNYERALVLNKASLDMICAPSVGEEQAAKFEKSLLCCQIHF